MREHPKVMTTASMVGAIDLLLDEIKVDVTPREADTLVQYLHFLYTHGMYSSARFTLELFVGAENVQRVEDTLLVPQVFA